MMRRLLIFVVAFGWGSHACRAWTSEDGYVLTDFGKTKVLVLKGSETKDGAYALGWTVRAKDAKTPPVDWSQWDKDEGQPRGFFGTYVYNNLQPNPYEYVDLVLDLRHKKMLVLPDGEFVNSHACLEIAWGPEVHGRRFGFVENRGRHEEINVWLISMEGAKMRVADLYDALKKGVAPLLRDRRPYDYGVYDKWFPVNGNAYGERWVVFHGDSADVPFEGDNSHDDTEFKGWVSVRLPEGKAGKAWSDVPRYDPYAGDSKLAVMNRKLNAIYSDLLPQLKPGARAALEKEEREWVRERDGDARKMAWSGDSTFQTYLPMLEATWKRASILKALPNGYRKINLGASRALVFKGTESPGGRYAIGWTVRPRPNSPAVDWSDWDEADDPWDIESEYEFAGEQISDSEDEIVNCVIDLGEKKTLFTLPTDFPGQAQGHWSHVATAWSAGADGRSYALVQSESCFHTINFWLVTIGPEGMSEVDLTPELTKRALGIVHDKRPWADAADYKDGVVFGSRGIDHRKIAFHGESADVPFVADVPKDWEANSEVKGWITVNLREASVEKGVSDTRVDDPFADDPAVAKAEREMNEVYAALLKTLPPTDAAALKAGQQDWIAQRRVDAAKAGEDTRGWEETTFPKARNEVLLRSTRDRIAELKGMKK